MWEKSEEVPRRNSGIGLHGAGFEGVLFGDGWGSSNSHRLHQSMESIKL